MTVPKTVVLPITPWGIMGYAKGIVLMYENIVPYRPRGTKLPRQRSPDGRVGAGVGRLAGEVGFFAKL